MHYVLRQGGHALTRMPGRSLDLLKPNTQKVLVYLQNRGDDDRNREVLLDERIIEIQRRLDELAVIVTIIPDIEFAVEGDTQLFVLLLLQCEQGFAVLDTDGSEFFLKVIEELIRR